MTNIYNIQKTTEQIKQEEITRQASTRQGSIIAFAYSILNAYNDFWFNPILTPQEQCDILGASAVTLFTEHAACVQFVLDRMPNITDYVPTFMSVATVPADKEVNVSNTGAVTITNKTIEE